MKILILLLCGSCLALTPTTATPLGLFDLGWDNCVGAGGTRDKTFACSTNTGSATMVASVLAPAGIVLWTSFETYINFEFSSGVDPAWWQLRNQTNQSGQCRNGSLSASADFTGAPYLGACLDVYKGQAGGGIAAYTLTGGGRASMKLTFGVSSTNQVPLIPGVEYFASRATINYAKTIGAGSCSGCCDPVLVYLLLVRVLQPAGTPGGNVDVTTWRTNYWLSWNYNNPSCGVVVPTRSPTWGAIKALYR
jgi:hypothetical protein